MQSKLRSISTELKKQNKFFNFTKLPPAVQRSLPMLVISSTGLIWALFGRIPVKVVGSGIMIVPRSFVEMDTRVSGKLIALYVKTGDHVLPGQLLAKLQLPDLDQQLLNLENNLRELVSENKLYNQIQKQQSNLVRRNLQIEATAVPRELASIDREISSNNREIQADKIKILSTIQLRKTYKQRVDQLNQINVLLEPALQSYYRLAAKGVVARLDSRLIDALNSEQLNRNQITSLKASIENTLGTQEELQSKIKNLTSQNENLKAKKIEQISKLESLKIQDSQLNLTDYKSDVQRQNAIDDNRRSIAAQKVKIQTDSKVLSIYEGEVAQISAVPDNYLQAGGQLGILKVKTPNKEDVVYAFFTPEDAVRILPGMTVEFDPDRLTSKDFGGTRERFGGIIGHVIAVSKNTVTEDEVTSIVGTQHMAKNLMQNPLPTQENQTSGKNLPVVQVTIALEKDPNNVSGYKWTDGGHIDTKFPEGSIGATRVTVEQRSLINYFGEFFSWLTGVYNQPTSSSKTNVEKKQ